MAEAKGTTLVLYNLQMAAALISVAVPLLFFLLPLILATIGPGNIAAVALIAPLAMGSSAELASARFS